MPRASGTSLRQGQQGQFRSRADIKAEQDAARFESLLIAREELYWQAQEQQGFQPLDGTTPAQA